MSAIQSEATIGKERRKREFALQFYVNTVRYQFDRQKEFPRSIHRARKWSSLHASAFRETSRFHIKIYKFFIALGESALKNFSINKAKEETINFTFKFNLDVWMI